MVTGKRGYEAEDISDTLAAVLTREVDWKALPADTPARLKALVRDCLVRDPKERLRDIGDARRELQRLIEGAPDPTAAAGTPPAVSVWRRWLPWGVAAAALIVAGIAAMSALKPEASISQPIVRTQVELKDFSALIDISNDGTKVAYAVAGGQTPPSSRADGSVQAKPVAGTGGGVRLIFSPDGQRIAQPLDEFEGRKIPLTAARRSRWRRLVLEARLGADDRIVFPAPED
jgi:serine/threonine-protein kinase